MAALGHHRYLLQSTPNSAPTIPAAYRILGTDDLVSARSPSLLQILLGRNPEAIFYKGLILLIHLYSQTEDKRYKARNGQKAQMSSPSLGLLKTEDGRGEAENRQKANQI